MMISKVATSLLLIAHSSGVRLSTLLRNTGLANKKTATADPYEWELVSNPVSGNSCFSLSENLPNTDKLLTVRDSGCVGFSEDSKKCRSGFPFYRFVGGPSNCVDCLDAGRCQMMCLSKGLDAAALILDKTTHNPVECRCGATKKNLSIWGILKSASDDGNINFGPVHSLLPPTVNSAIPSDDARCAMYMYVYKDAREEDGGVPDQFVDITADDETYIRSIVSGVEALDDVEDSGKDFAVLLNKAMQERLKLWVSTNPSNKFPIDEIFVEQLSTLDTSSGQDPKCKDVDEPPNCADDALQSVLNVNNIKIGDYVDGSGYDFTPAYANLLMTVPYKQLLGLYQGATQPITAGGFSYRSSGYCSSPSVQQNCKITCGVCESYDRPAKVATKYNTWMKNKNPTNGVITIPILMNKSNPLVTSALQTLVLQAAAIVAQISCVNFTAVDSVGPRDLYVNVTVDVGPDGKPSGCMADPPGLAESPSTPISLTIGGCSFNAKPLGSLVHELLHVLSLVHTQMRSDRDDYIQMNPIIVKKFFEANFFLEPYSFVGSDGNYSPYDYGSIMHYTRTQAADVTQFKANPQLGGTFSLLKPLQNGVTLGQRTAMSNLDISEINTVNMCRGVIASNPATFGLQSSGSATTTSTTTAGGAATTTPTTPPPSSTNAWDGWEKDIETIADAIDVVLTNSQINLNEKQTDALEGMIETQKKLFDVFNNAISKQNLKLGWRELIVSFAKNVLAIVGESRSGISQFAAGNNEEQSGILDLAAISQLEKIIKTTVALYSKLDTFAKTLPGAISMHEKVDMKHPSVEGPVMVFGGNSHRRPRYRSRPPKA